MGRIVRGWMYCACLFSMSGFGQLMPVNLQATDKSDIVAVKLTRFGANPASVVHGPEPFILAITNRSGVLQDTYSLVLKPSGGLTAGAASLLDLHSTVDRQRDYQMIQLTPGDYQIRFQGHPSWVVDITISAQ